MSDLQFYAPSPQTRSSCGRCLFRIPSFAVTNLKQNEAQSARAQSTHKGVNQRSKYITQVQQQRPESPTVTLTWHACKYKVHKLRYILSRWEFTLTRVYSHLERMYRNLCTLYITVGDSDLCCCTCVTYFERWLTPLCVDSFHLYVPKPLDSALFRTKVPLPGTSCH